MIKIFYTDHMGSIFNIEVFCEAPPNSRILDEVCDVLINAQCLNLKGFHWLRQSVPLTLGSIIYSGDRLFALRASRLSPEVWRAQRINRVDQYIK